MNRIVSMLVTAGLFAGSILLAQEGGRRGRGQNRGNRPQMQMQMNAETAKKWSDLQSQLKKKYPDKFAEIEKLAQTNLAEANMKMIQLARQAKLKIPMPAGRGGFRGRGGQGGEGFGGGRGEGFGGGRGEGFGGGRGGFGRGEGFGGGRGGFGRGGMGMMGNRERAEAEAKIKAKFPKEYAAIEKSREQAEEQLQALAKKADVKLPMTQEAMMKKMAAIREKYKSEFEEINKLRQEDPQAARERTNEIFKREGIEMPMMGMGGFRRQEGNSQQAPRQPRRGNSGQDMRKKMDQIRKAYPEEVKKLQSLREEDPQKFRQEMKKLADRYDREHGGK